MPKILSDDEVRKLASKKKLVKGKSDHPFIQHMAKLEGLIAEVGLSNEKANRILKTVADMLIGGNTDLAEKLVTIQEQLNTLTNRLTLDNDNEVWMATVKTRDNARLLQTVEFKRITRPEGNA